MEHLNPRGSRVVALEKPSEMERGQWYFQRASRGCPQRERSSCSIALRQVPEFERNLVRGGIHLIKFWFSVRRPEQRRRFQ